MKYSRVLLVALPSQPHRAPRPSIGLGYVAEALEDARIEYDILDMLLGYDVDALKRKIALFKPDLVGFNMFTHHYLRSYGIIQKIKQSFPRIKTVVGGPHISTLKAQVLKDCPAIDYGVMYEGEERLLRLCGGEEEALIPGLVYREDGEVICNEPRSFKERYIQDLERVSFPTYRKFELNKYINKEIPLSTSRGCPYRCIFCTVPSVVGGRKIRTRSAGNVVDEIEFWVRKGYTTFTVDDDNFTFYNERIYEICDEIERRGLENLEFRLHNGVRPDRLSRELLARMKEVGFNYIEIAVEGGNDRILKSLRKAEKLDTIKKTIRDACEVGMEVYLGFVIGAPEETWSDIEDSFRVASQFPVWKVDFLNLLPYPGTELFEWVEKNGYFIKDPQVYLNEDPNYFEPVFETPLLSREERVRAIELREETNKRLLYETAKRKLKRYGVLGAVAARIFSSYYFQQLYFRNRTVRRLSDGMRRIIS